MSVTSRTNEHAQEHEPGGASQSLVEPDPEEHEGDDREGELHPRACVFRARRHVPVPHSAQNLGACEIFRKQIGARNRTAAEAEKGDPSHFPNDTSGVTTRVARSSPGWLTCAPRRHERFRLRPRRRPPALSAQSSPVSGTCPRSLVSASRCSAPAPLPSPVVPAHIRKLLLQPPSPPRRPWCFSGDSPDRVT